MYTLFDTVTRMKVVRMMMTMMIMMIPLIGGASTHGNVRL